ncbi:DNA repair protein RecO [Alteromonas sp. ASW11-130]|uniref:DNA repair protein RecO n=1 Tax=Alteromonas sp. ASW11-130 TaxID=3015775 RepID=UPI0022423F46|nr:DNA repair protein RecO [Alteromonas sp. ASW11-130]MCW8090472.1 DNA repair protein RecO [Alteromonas sp. ASW11-130]
MPVSEWLNACVLHRRPYRETSYLVDFFTLESGKVSAVAKGVRNSRSERKSLLQPFQPLRIQLSGKGELKNLTLMEGTSNAYPLTGFNLFCAMYLNELINRILQPDLPVSDLFAVYQRSLIALANLSHGGTQDAQIVLREFEFALLAEMGVLVDLSVTTDLGCKVDPSEYYMFDAEQGLTLASPNYPQKLPGSHILAVVHKNWSIEALRIAKFVNRLALRPLLGDKPLKSRELFTLS